MTLCFTEFHVWQWEDEHKKWNPYNIMATVALEKASISGKTSLSMDICNRHYTIDLKTMEQINDDTRVKRNIKMLNISKYISMLII